MGRLFALFLLGLGLLLVCAACFARTLHQLVRREGWRRGLLAALCPLYAFAWGWRRDGAAIGWMRLWTAAALLFLVDFALVDLSMG